MMYACMRDRRACTATGLPKLKQTTCTYAPAEGIVKSASASTPSANKRQFLSVYTKPDLKLRISARSSIRRSACLSVCLASLSLSLSRSSSYPAKCCRGYVCHFFLLVDTASITCPVPISNEPNRWHHVRGSALHFSAHPAAQLSRSKQGVRQLCLFLRWLPTWLGFGFLFCLLQ